VEPQINHALGFPCSDPEAHKVAEFVVQTYLTNMGWKSYEDSRIAISKMDAEEAVQLTKEMALVFAIAFHIHATEGGLFGLTLCVSVLKNIGELQPGQTSTTVFFLEPEVKTPTVWRRGPEEMDVMTFLGEHGVKNLHTRPISRDPNHPDALACALLVNMVKHDRKKYNPRNHHINPEIVYRVEKGVEKIYGKSVVGYYFTHQN
jgi:hypothetical protein